MSRRVKGVLFAEYARMIRGNKSFDWASQLAPEDLPFLGMRIDPAAWYPMTTFERFGNAILRNVANSDLQAVRMWGRFSVDEQRAQKPELVAAGDPVETLQRFRVLRSTFFDFPALEIPMLLDDQAEVIISYGMGAIAEEAASFQTMGFFERQLELAGATNVSARLAERSWAGDARTLLALAWELNPAGGRARS
ncbi:MAG TPA: hypothetical protein VGL86_20885 [Polyangia bacterium]